MPNIKPDSDLRNYNEVLRDVAEGEKAGREKGWLSLNEVEKSLGL